MDKVRVIIALMAFVALLYLPWLTLTASGGGTLGYSIFRVKASGGELSMSYTYPEMQLRYIEGKEKGIDVALAARLASYMKLFQVWAIITAGLFALAMLIEKHKKVYLASALSILGMATVYFVVAYNITKDLGLIKSATDILLGKAIGVKMFFSTMYLTLELNVGWYLAIATGIFMLIYWGQYKYWRLVGTF